MQTVKLPELGEGVTEGELVKWLVKPGDQVSPDQPIAEVMTDKATVEVPSPVAGVVKNLMLKEGDTVKVEAALLTLDGLTNGAAGASKAAPAAAVAKSDMVSAGQTRPIHLPELGEGVAEGELVKWLVKPGDQVTPDQPIAEVMTDKATVEVPTPVGGQVAKLHFKEGDTVKVESALIDLVTSGATAPVAKPAATTSAAQAFSKPVAASVSVPASNGAGSITPPPADIRVLATPSTRRLARELSVDINTLVGTGLAGRVTREDVLAAERGAGQASAGDMTFKKPAALVPGAGEERVPLKGIRKKIAENMQMAKRVVPHFTLMDEAIVTELVKARDEVKAYAESQGVKVTYLPFVMKALVATVRDFPMFNASIDDEKQEIVYKNYFNIGFAADTPNGLMVPVIKGADAKSIIELSREILELSKKARDGKLKPDEMKGATITITNIGSVGGTYATPIINHPEVAILGMYKISDKIVVAEDGNFGVEKAMNFTITADHRLIDGAVAANFLKAFIQRVGQPGRLLLDLR